MNGVPNGKSTDFPSYFPDWFPTLCEMAGIEAPSGLDGISIAPALVGRTSEQSERNPMIWIYPEYGGQVAVRFGPHVVLRTGLKGKKKPNPWEAYNVVTDPNETTDLSTSNPELIEKAKKILKANWSENEKFGMSKDRAFN